MVGRKVPTKTQLKAYSIFYTHRWCEAQGYKVNVVDRAPGDEAGIKSVELEVQGAFAYGYLKCEKGTHRLVRNSPFNSKGLRQTSFAGVEVMPLLGDMQVRGAAGGCR